MLRKPQTVIFALSLTLFIISLTQYTFTVNNDAHYGWLDLAFGWLLLFSPANWCWFANPLQLLSWIFLFNSNKPKLPLILSLIATLLAASFLLYNQVISNEAGHLDDMHGYGPGYWLWLASCGTSFIGSMILYWKQRSAISR